MKRILIFLFVGLLGLAMSGCAEKKTICSDGNVKNTIISIYKNKFLVHKGVPANIVRAVELSLSKAKIIERKEVKNGFHTLCEAKMTAVWDGKKNSAYIRYTTVEDITSGGRSVNLETQGIEFMPEFPAEKKSICTNPSFTATIVSIYKTKFLQYKGVPDAVAKATNLQLTDIKELERTNVGNGFHTMCEARVNAEYNGTKGTSFIRYKAIEDNSGGKSVNLESQNIDFMPAFAGKKSICENPNFTATIVSIYKTKFLQYKGVPDAVAKATNLQLTDIKELERKNVGNGFHTMCEARVNAEYNGNTGSSLIQYLSVEDNSGGRSVDLKSHNIDFMPKYELPAPAVAPTPAVKPTPAAKPAPAAKNNTKKANAKSKNANSTKNRKPSDPAPKGQK